MGTASTMASVCRGAGDDAARAGGDPGAGRAAPPPGRGDRPADRRVVEQDLRPSQIITREAFENAIRVAMALGGSTNAVVHLLAIAGRPGIDLPLDDFDRLARDTPLIANVRPSGQVADGGALRGRRHPGRDEGARCRCCTATA